MQPSGVFLFFCFVTGTNQLLKSNFDKKNDVRKAAAVLTLCSIHGEHRVFELTHWVPNFVETTSGRLRA